MEKENMSQSPSLRGSGRFPNPGGGAAAICESQSPSLRGSGRFTPTSMWWSSLPARLNPLHCGAVVASKPRRAATPSAEVSIPFIAGQWSLLDATVPRFLIRFASQSPSLRGSGRFDVIPVRCYFISCWSQSPSLRGSGRFYLR